MNEDLIKNKLDNYDFSNFDDALKALVNILKNHIKSHEDLNKILEVISFENKQLPMRAVSEEFKKYRKKESYYVEFSANEIDAWNDLFHFWG